MSSLSTLSVLSLYLFNVFREGRRRKKKIHISVIYMTHESYGLAHIATRSIPDSIRHNDVQQQKKRRNKQNTLY